MNTIVALLFLRARWNAFSAPTETPLRAETQIRTLSAAATPSYSPSSKSKRPGASIRLYLIPSYSTGTTDADKLAWRLASSGSKSDTVVPSSTRPIRSSLPALNSSASTSVVLPQPAWPATRMLRMLLLAYFILNSLFLPCGFRPFCGISYKDDTTCLQKIKYSV